jgi:hypothetical protein
VTPILVVAVVVAQVLDVVTWMAMPRAAEVNPLAQGLHSSSAWLLKTALVGLVFALDEVVRIAPPPKYSVVAVAGRQLAEVVVVLAIAAGFLGAGSNLAVIAYVNASETPRSAPEPALVASEAMGIEQGALAPAAPARIPAPRLNRHEAPDIPRGTASWYAASGLVAAAGPALRRALGRPWRGRVVRVVAGGRAVTVRLVDWCRCYRDTAGERLIDLGDEAFVRLAPLSAGLLPVEVFAVRRIRIQPPATDR